MQKFEFIAELMKHPGIDATYVLFPFNVETLFGTKGQVKVKAIIDDAIYRGSLANMGLESHVLIVTQAIRKQINKRAGDTVKIILEKDTEERVISIPDDLKKLFLVYSESKSIFDSLSYTHKKEYIQWIESAKKAETRERRINKVIDMLNIRKKKRN